MISKEVKDSLILKFGEDFVEAALLDFKECGLFVPEFPQGMIDYTFDLFLSGIIVGYSENSRVSSTFRT